MKGITNKSITLDKKAICEIAERFGGAIWENQEHQSAHYDNQPKIVRLAIRDVYVGLNIAIEALRNLESYQIIED